MKKLIFLIVLFFGIMPIVKHGKLTLNGVTSVYADDYGGEDIDSNDPCDPNSSAYDLEICNGQPDNGDPCDPSSSAYDPAVCNATDQCDENSPYYDPAVCEQQSCNPQSTNYDVDECDAQVCDDNSVGTNASECEIETCDPDNINYDVDECDAQVCDDNSVRTNASECEIETCDPDNINYDVDECDAQVCDPNSVRTDASECEIETCDPDNINYDPAECNAQICDPTSVNYNPVLCACPCLKNLTSTPTGGLLRNYDGTIIRSVVGTQDELYLPGLTLHEEWDKVYSSNGTPMDVLTVTGYTLAPGYSLPLDFSVDNLGYNCLGWALADGQYLVGANWTSTVDTMLGITSISDGITSGAITMDNNATSIQPGQILLGFHYDSASNTYVYEHAAINTGSDMYSTKNGMGLGTVGVENQNLATIKGIYENATTMGVNVVNRWGYINAPSETNSTSNLGINTDGVVSAADIAAAKANGCNCNK
jgi:hypothetical protein